IRLEVLDVPKYNSESEEESWTFSLDDEDDVDESDMNDDSEETESDNDGDDLTYPNLLTYKADNKEEEEEKADDGEVSSDQRVYTTPDYQLTDEEENQKGDDEVKEGKEEQGEEEELYRDLNINMQRSDAEKTDAQQENIQANQVTKDTHADEPVTPSKSKYAPAAKGTRLKTPAKVTQSDKKRRPTSVPKAKGLVVLYEVALTEAEQIELATKRSKKYSHLSHASG
nr:hypothetical protein [Tanacetum cinerariifolium]